MKVSNNLLKAISLGITVSVFTAACQRGNCQNPAYDEPVKEKKPKKEKPAPCPACGMG